MSGRLGAPSSGSMTYGMAPPMHPHHLNQGADSSVPTQTYGGHQQQMSQYGTSQVGSNFAYSNQGFYGHPAQHHPSEVASQQHAAGYYSHHTSSPQMDPNGQLYAAHQMSHPDMMSGGQFQGHHADLLAHQHDYALQGAGIRPKRKQVKNACVNCQKACKKCDEGRPCGRCVKYGLVDTCQDSARKERRRGIKRGPYKRRATTGSQPNNPSLSVSGPMSSYGRDGHISPSSRSDGMLGSTPGGESSFSSPAFGTQVLAPRPPMPLQMPSNGWQPSTASPVDDREGLRARYGQPIASNQPSYYGYEQDAAHHAYDRGSSAPVAQPGSMLSPVGRFPNSATPQSSNSQLPSLGSQSSSNGSYLGGVYGSSGGRVGGMSNGSTSSLVSPPLHSSASNTSFLSASSAPNGIAHHRLHSDSSLATLSSNGASSSTMSPRTPLNGPGAEPPLLSPSGNKMSGFTPPQPTVPTASGTFLQQDVSRPFPLKMPKAPTRGRSGTGSSYVDQQSQGYYANNLAPINVKVPAQAQQPQQQQQFQRSSPYMAVQSINDDRRQFSNNMTPRMDLSPNPGMMSLKADRDVAGAPPPAPAGSLGLA